jgi:hypothetical protein
MHRGMGAYFREDFDNQFHVDVLSPWMSRPPRAGAISNTVVRVVERHLLRQIEASDDIETLRRHAKLSWLSDYLKYFEVRKRSSRRNAYGKHIEEGSQERQMIVPATAGVGRRGRALPLLVTFNGALVMYGLWDALRISRAITARGGEAIDDLIAAQASEELFLDFKRSADDGKGRALHSSDRNNLAKAISGFGNSGGGVVLWVSMRLLGAMAVTWRRPR